MTTRPILVVDADGDSRTIYEALFESAGYTVYSCADGDDASRLARQIDPALVITELHLGSRSAWDLASAIATDAAESPPPMLLVTADVSAHIQEHAYRAGYAAWFTKPYDSARLLGTVRQLVGPPEQVPAG